MSYSNPLDIRSQERAQAEVDERVRMASQIEIDDLKWTRDSYAMVLFQLIGDITYFLINDLLNKNFLLGELYVRVTALTRQIISKQKS